MRTASFPPNPIALCVGVAVLSLWLTPALYAQDLRNSLPDLGQPSTVLPVLPAPFWGNVAQLSTPRQPPVHLFLMQPAFLFTPVGLDDDDDSDTAGNTPIWFDPDIDITARLQVSMGNVNPFFDFQAADNPGGYGYYQLHTQYQVVDATDASVCLGLQAFTPAGLESDGLAHGPTVFRPNLSWWQDLGNGCGLNGYVCKSVRSGAAVFDRIEQGYRCGLAWENPLTDDDRTTSGSVHFFMEALARYQPDTFNGQRPPAWEVLPGLHWQFNQNCWLSGAYVLPVGPSRDDNALWQLTCWWKF
jgi:hypothetical protein